MFFFSLNNDKDIVCRPCQSIQTGVISSRKQLECFGKAGFKLKCLGLVARLLQQCVGICYSMRKVDRISILELKFVINKGHSS